MEHGISECIKQQSDTEVMIKIEMEEATSSTANTEIEIDLSQLKQEPELVHFMERELPLLVKEEIPEDSRQDDNGQQYLQGTSTPAGTGSVSTACIMSLDDLLNVKHETEPNDMDIGPTVLQRMDTHYAINQEMSDATEENTILYDCGQPPLHTGVKESFVDNLRGSHQQQEMEMRDSGMCHALQCLELKIRKDCLKSICRVYLRRLETFHCKLCDAIYTENRLLLRHLQSIHRPRPKTPLVKFRKTKRKKRRISGRQTHSYHCDKCVKIFRLRKTFKRHYEAIHGTECYKCAECHREFKCRLYLQRHIKYMHTKKFECDICQKIFKSKDNIRHHIFGHHSDWISDSCSYLSTCDYCQKKFWRKPALRQHISIVHGERTHRCQMCKKIFKSGHDLQLHTTRIHGKPQHKCELCHKLFTTRFILRAHIKKSHDFNGSLSESDSFSQELHDPLFIADEMTAVVD